MHYLPSPEELHLSQGVPRCPKVSQGVPRCPKVSQGVPRCPKVSQGAQGQGVPSEPLLSESWQNDSQYSRLEHDKTLWI